MRNSPPELAETQPLKRVGAPQRGLAACG